MEEPPTILPQDLEGLRLREEVVGVGAARGGRQGPYCKTL